MLRNATKWLSLSSSAAAAATVDGAVVVVAWLSVWCVGRRFVVHVASRNNSSSYNNIEYKFTDME